MRFMDKEEFIERFLHDQAEKKKNPPKKKKRSSVIPFKEELTLDIINLFRELYDENDIEIVRGKEILLKFKDECFSVKIVAKRDRVAV